MDVKALDRSSHFSFRNIARAHGVGLRGLDVPRGSEQFEGRFGRMFRTLPAAEHDEENLEELATAMIAKDEGTAPNDNPDPEENSGITAGYTYFGQFIDHDITFDPASSLQKTNDPDALVDFRTPRFDLDCVYGRGPDDQPYIYRDDGLHMLLGRTLTGDSGVAENTRDVPRNTPDGSEPQRALLGDPRNDENVIVSQLQSTFLQFHNKVADAESTRLGHPPTFAHVQRLVRWHYQYAILNDFLPTICGKDTVFDVLPHLKSGKSIHVDKPNLRFFKWRDAPFMPVEFSVAAYRFGHSMVRPFYRLNSGVQFPIFAPGTADNSMRGFHAFPANWGIDWSLFFGTGPKSGPKRVQPAYKIDTSLVNPLGTLPDNVAKDIKSLAHRNLLRGLRMRLPSGQTVARKMGFPVIPDDKLFVGKATKDDSPGNPLLTDLSPDFADNAPLWYYVLAEAQQQFDGKDDTPIRLGAVGGRIVAEVFAGLLLGDNHSFLAQNPDWKPFAAFGGAKFGIFDLIKAALK